MPCKYIMQHSQREEYCDLLATGFGYSLVIRSTRGSIITQFHVISCIIIHSSVIVEPHVGLIMANK